LNSCVYLYLSIIIYYLIICLYIISYHILPRTAFGSSWLARYSIAVNKCFRPHRTQQDRFQGHRAGMLGPPKKRLGNFPGSMRNGWQSSCPVVLWLKNHADSIFCCSHLHQGLVTVPFWEYWTSPYSSHYRPYT
jgi:hypothetical protein